MTVLTTAILEDEKKPKLDEEAADAAAIPVVLTTKGVTPARQVHNNRRALPGRTPCRGLLFVITIISLLCALGGICYGIYHFARIGHNRPRVFCRLVIEDRPIKRSRIFSERAEISDDRHAVRLFVPNFMYAHRVYSSSVVLILENHGITVIKVEQSRTCFVKQIQQSREQYFHKRLSLPDWYRRVEEGSYLPNLTIMRRSWMAQMPHMSHHEAGVVFHPKVAEFCEDMKVFRMIEMHDRIGVVSYGGGLLPRCPLRKCRFPCPEGRYVHDRNNCRTCRCELPPPRRSYAAFKAACGPFICARICPLGFVTQVNGCPRCECKVHHRRIDKRSVEEPQQNCVRIPVAEGINPVEGSFVLDEIAMC